MRNCLLRNAQNIKFPVSNLYFQVTFEQETCCTYCHWKDRSFIFQQHALVTPCNSSENSSLFYFYYRIHRHNIWAFNRGRNGVIVLLDQVFLLCCLTNSFYYVAWLKGLFREALLYGVWKENSHFRDASVNYHNWSNFIYISLHFLGALLLHLYNGNDKHLNRVLFYLNG